jgi:hypothetical protein
MEAHAPTRRRLVTAPPAFLIVGTPRSGTTLVQRLCRELPGVGVPPETHFFSQLAPWLLRRPLPLDDDAVREALARFAALTTSRDLALDPAAVMERLPQGGAGALDLFGAIVAALAPGAEVLGEKTPNHLLWWRPVARALPGPRWNVVVRDPRAVVASYRTAWGARDHVVLAARWRSDQREAARLLDALPRSALLLRFEEVVAFPEHARARVARFLGVAVSAPVPVTQSSGLGAPWEVWKARAAGAIDPSRARTWEDVLSPREASDVVAIAGDAMPRFGYPAPARAARVAGRARIGPSARWRRARFRRRRILKQRRIARLGTRL